MTLVDRLNSTERHDKRAVIGREGISDANEDDNFAVQGKGILARTQGKSRGVISRNCDKRLPSKGKHHKCIKGIET